MMRAAHKDEASEIRLLLAVKETCLLTTSNVTILSATRGRGLFGNLPEALHCMRVLLTRAQQAHSCVEPERVACHIGIAARRALVACVNPYRSPTWRPSWAKGVMSKQ